MKGIKVENPSEIRGQVKVNSKNTTVVEETFYDKFRKGAKKALVVVIALAVLTGAGLGINSIVRNSKSTDNSYYSTVVGDFSVNSEKNMTDKVSKFIIDLKREGYDISYVDGANFYIFANGEQLSENFISELQFSYLTEETITKSVNRTANMLKEAYMDNRPINVANMFGSEKDAELINSILAISKEWDTTKDYEAVAKKFQAFTNEMYNSNKYTEYGSYANVLVMTILRGQMEKTVNSGYTIIDKELQDKLWGTDVNCFTVDANGNQVLNGNDIYSREYRLVKENMTSKLANANYDYSKKEEDTLGYKILLNVAKNVKESGVALGNRVDVQAIRDANKNLKSTPVKNNTTTTNNSGVNNNNTNTPSTQKPVEQQKEEIQEEIKKESETKKEEIKQEENLWQAGYDKGFADGTSGASKNITSSNSTYVTGYNLGYKDGYAIYELSNEEEEKTVIVEEHIELEDGVYVDPSTGYVYKDGEQQFNADGTPLVMGQNGETIKVKQK